MIVMCFHLELAYYLASVLGESGRNNVALSKALNKAQLLRWKVLVSDKSSICVKSGRIVLLNRFTIFFSVLNLLHFIK